MPWLGLPGSNAPARIPVPANVVMMPLVRSTRRTRSPGRSRPPRAPGRHRRSRGRRACRSGRAPSRAPEAAEQRGRAAASDILRVCGLATAVPAGTCSRSGRRARHLQPPATPRGVDDGFRDGDGLVRAKGHGAWRRTHAMRRAYHRLPEGLRRCLRPLNLLDEVASFLPARARPGAHGAAEAMRRLGRIARIRYPVRRLEGTVHASGRQLTCLVAGDELSARYWTTTVFA